MHFGEGQSNHIKLVELPDVHRMWDDKNLYDDKTSFLTQRHNTQFEVQASNAARLKLELDQSFKNDMNQAIQNLERIPQLKTKIWTQLNEFNLQQQ